MNYLFLNEQEILFLKSRKAIALIENNNFQELYEFFRYISLKIFYINSQGKIILEKERFKKSYNLICIGPDNTPNKRIFIN